MTWGRILGLIGLALLVAWFVLPIPSAFVERAYSRGLYPVISSVIVPVTNAVPFSIAGVMLFALPVAGLVAFIVSFRRWVPNRTWWARWAWRALGLIVVIGAWFVLTWGANYRRVPLTTQLELETRTSSPNADALRARFERVILEDVPSDAPDQARALESISKAIATFTQDTTGVTPTLPRRVKRTPAGFLIAGGSAVGVVSPWTLEAHVDGALPAVGIVAYGAHELAHVAGFAQESDAEVISALAGLRADDAFARYAIALRWWAELRPTDATVWKKAKARLPSRAQNDLATLFTAIRAHQPPAFLQSFQRSSYDAYLKTQRVPDGIQNYGIAVQYLVVALEKGLL
jgi:Protein of unknown function (DUF3810)